MLRKAEIPRSWKAELPMSRKVELPTLNCILTLNNSLKFEVTYMVKRKMYKQIKKLKLKGISQAKVAKNLSINRKTVRKYWDMSDQDYHQYLNNMQFRNKEFDSLKSEIISIYEANEFKNLQAAAVYDYLEEKFKVLPASEKSLRNYIHYLTESQQLTVKMNVRMYQKVPELPLGKQMQIDFGVYKLKSGIKLYIFASVLSSSRFKYIAFQDKPFKTKCLINHLLNCFDYIGGIPEEIVIDQDTIMVVSENHGDIIFTKDFSAFKDEMNLKIHTCRKADPESKGKIENVIKFVKNNFLSVRNFNTLQEAQDSVSKWLTRRANGKISQATKRIPAIDFEKEKMHLNPLKNSIFKHSSLLARDDRSVNDKSFISFSGSQYSVPVKYKSKSVDIYPTETELFIFDKYTGEEIACHMHVQIPGNKSILREHFREKSKKVDDLKQEVLKLFKFPQWQDFVQINFKSFPRYTRDQCILAKKHFSFDVQKDILLKSIKYCQEDQSYSFTALLDVYNYHKNETALSNRPVIPIPIKPTVRVNSPDVAQRSLDIYTDVLNKNQEVRHDCR